MSVFEDFNEGDTVQHSGNGMGAVEASVDGCGRVRCDCADKDGKHWDGMVNVVPPTV